MRKDFVMHTWFGVCTAAAKHISFVNNDKVIRLNVTIYQQNLCIPRSANYKSIKL